MRFVVMLVVENSLSELFMDARRVISFFLFLSICVQLGALNHILKAL
jgi:hypothetical protein